MNIARYFYEGRDRDLALGVEERLRHTTVIGKTGMGKSTLLENLAIEAMRENHGLLFVDPHGASVTELLTYVPNKRIKDVCYISADTLVGINPFYKPMQPELEALSLTETFEALFKESWGPRLHWWLFNGILLLMRNPNTTLLELPKLYVAAPMPGIATLTPFWEHEYPSYDIRFRAEASSPILNKIGMVLALPETQRMFGSITPTFSMKDALEKNLIVLVNLSKARFSKDAANLLGSILLSQTLQASFNRKSTIPFHVIVDEFPNFTTSAVPEMVAELRKRYVSLTMGMQWIEQLPPHNQEAVLNVGTLICFQLSATDAQRLSPDLRWPASELSDLRPFHAFVKRGFFYEAYPTQTLPRVPRHHRQCDSVERVLAQSARRFGLKQSAKLGRPIVVPPPLRQAAAGSTRRPPMGRA